MRAGLGRLFAVEKKRERRILALKESDAWLGRSVPWYPQAPELQPKDLALLQSLRQQLGDELEPGEIVSDLDVLCFALQELAHALKGPTREDAVLKLLFYLFERSQQPETR